MKKKAKKVLTLSRETLRELELMQAGQIVGGVTGSICGTCDSTRTCCP